jgi:hypothetical protein
MVLDYRSTNPRLRAGVPGRQRGDRVRDQGIVVVTGAVAGLTTLGYWSLAYRIVQVVVVVLEKSLAGLLSGSGPLDRC